MFAAAAVVQNTALTRARIAAAHSAFVPLFTMQPLSITRIAVLLPDCPAAGFLRVHAGALLTAERSVAERGYRWPNPAPHSPVIPRAHLRRPRVHLKPAKGKSLG